MRKTALLLLIFFAFAQAGPVIYSLFQPGFAIFQVDEENTEVKPELEKKDKKDYTLSRSPNPGNHTGILSTLHPVEKIGCPPYLEKPTPPPNFL